MFIALGAQLRDCKGTQNLVTVAVSANTGIPVVGLAATGIIGFVNVWGEVDDDQTPNWTPIASADRSPRGTVYLKRKIQTGKI